MMKVMVAGVEQEKPVMMKVTVDGVEQEKQTCQYLDKCATPEPTEKPVST